MKLEMPSRDEISAAEQRFATSKWYVLDDALQLRLAVRSRIAKPSSLAIAAGTAAILGFLLVRRPKPKPAPPPERRKKQQPSQLKALLTTLLLRFGRERLMNLMHNVAHAPPQRPRPAPHHVSATAHRPVTPSYHRPPEQSLH